MTVDQAHAILKNEQENDSLIKKIQKLEQINEEQKQRE